jgi:hypothetical protein
MPIRVLLVGFESPLVAVRLGAAAAAAAAVVFLALSASVAPGSVVTGRFIATPAVAVLLPATVLWLLGACCPVAGSSIALTLTRALLLGLIFAFSLAPRLLPLAELAGRCCSFVLAAAKVPFVLAADTVVGCTTAGDLLFSPATAGLLLM